MKRPGCGVVGVRVLADPFVVAPPGGASIRTRLCVTDVEHDLLVEAGDLLAGLRNRDMVRLLEWNQTAPKDRSKAERRTEAAARKRVLTAESSSRIANSVVRSNNDSWALAWRNLWAHRRTLRNQIKTLTSRCAIEPGERVNGAKGYRDHTERAMKQQRPIQRHLTLASVQGRIDQRRPKICVGGASLARLRHNLPDTDLDVDGWRECWDAARRFLTFIGTSGECFGNDTLIVDPDTGVVTLNLPAALKHHSNTPGPRRLYRFAQPVVFGHKTRSVEWAARAEARGGIRYGLRFDPDAKRGRGAWYLNASWATTPTTIGGVAGPVDVGGGPQRRMDRRAGRRRSRQPLRCSHHHLRAPARRHRPTSRAAESRCRRAVGCGCGGGVCVGQCRGPRLRRHQRHRPRDPRTRQTSQTVPTPDRGHPHRPIQSHDRRDGVYPGFGGHSGGSGLHLQMGQQISVASHSELFERSSLQQPSRCCGGDRETRPWFGRATQSL